MNRAVGILVLAALLSHFTRTWSQDATGSPTRTMSIEPDRGSSPAIVTVRLPGFSGSIENVAVTTSHGPLRVLDSRNEFLHVLLTTPEDVQGPMTIAATTSASVSYMGTFVVVRASPEQRARREADRKKYESAGYADPK